MSRADYCPNTAEETRAMLDAVGVESIADLFGSIPEELRSGLLDMPQGMSEFEILSRMRDLAGKNGRNLINFIGGGFYDHFIPAVVDHLSSRAEFYTAYTPYQAECSQGTLQALYEYQTAICALTGMEVSNASLYDGGTALAEAALMAMRITGRNKLILDEGVNPFYRQILRTYLGTLPTELVEVGRRPGKPGAGNLPFRVDEDVAAVISQNPDFFGSIDDIAPIAEKAHARGALVIVSAYPISLGLVKSPGEMGADIVTGDGQSLGNPLSFGGPSFGFIAARKQHVRNLPGRIVGETADREGRRGFVLTLQAREQHIKRHRATSNICSNQSLCALRGLMFLCGIGRQGIRELAGLNRDKAEYAKAVLGAVRGVSVLNSAPTFNEFTLQLPFDAAAVVEKLLVRGIAGGVPLESWYGDMKNCLVVTVTEKRTREELDIFANALEETLWS
jgi:glycine dehydrogenase subunit 1